MARWIDPSPDPARLRFVGSYSKVLGLTAKAKAPRWAGPFCRSNFVYSGRILRVPAPLPQARFRKPCLSLDLARTNTNACIAQSLAADNRSASAHTSGQAIQSPAPCAFPIRRTPLRRRCWTRFPPLLGFELLYHRNHPVVVGFRGGGEGERGDAANRRAHCAVAMHVTPCLPPLRGLTGRRDLPPAQGVWAGVLVLPCADRPTDFG